ncbi:MAG: hypothetical protein HRT90_07785 [Candidatus Margulisbacteria bacterium]|nr:hypothetical protein [Candidatus Margulisiibacteriota bacterium]
MTEKEQLALLHELLDPEIEEFDPKLCKDIHNISHMYQRLKQNHSLRSLVFQKSNPEIICQLCENRDISIVEFIEGMEKIPLSTQLLVEYLLSFPHIIRVFILDTWRENNVYDAEEIQKTINANLGFLVDSVIEYDQKKETITPIIDQLSKVFLNTSFSIEYLQNIVYYAFSYLEEYPKWVQETIKGLPVLTETGPLSSKKEFEAALNCGVIIGVDDAIISRASSLWENLVTRLMETMARYPKPQASLTVISQLPQRLMKDVLTALRDKASSKTPSIRNPALAIQHCIETTEKVSVSLCLCITRYKLGYNLKDPC